MRYRKLSSDGDYTFGGSERDFWRDVPEAVGQAAQTRLLLWFGEWYQNIEEGTPFMQGILGKHSQDLANTVVQDRVLGTQGLTTIEDFSSTLDPDSRSYSAEMTVNTIYGVTDVQMLNYSYY